MLSQNLTQDNDTLPEPSMDPAEIIRYVENKYKIFINILKKKMHIYKVQNMFILCSLIVIIQSTNLHCSFVVF